VVVAETRAARPADQVDVFARETTAHFREEEELLFPLVRRYADSPPALLAQVLSEHMQLHGFARRLEAALAAGIVDRDLLGEIGALLEAHIRLEERELFRLIQELVPSDELEALPLGGGACPVRG